MTSFLDPLIAFVSAHPWLAYLTLFLAALLEADGDSTGERRVGGDCFLPQTRALWIAWLSAPHFTEELESVVVDVE